MMALINCPECGKEISDRAYSCPTCGFPIHEYLEEQQEKKEKELELQREKERQKKIEITRSEYSDEKAFIIKNTTIKLNRNKIICAYVGAELNKLKNVLHEDVVNLFFDIDNGPSKYRPNEFYEYASNLAYSLVKRIMTRTSEIYKRIMVDAGYNFDDIDESNIKILNYDEITKSLIKRHREEYEDFDLARMNASVEYTHTTATNDDYIQRVYASSIIGLVKKDITSKIVNSCVKMLKHSSVQSKLIKAERDYGQTLLKATIKLNISVFGVFDSYVDNAVETYHKYLLDELLKNNCLFEIEMYPKDGFDSTSIFEFFEDESRSNEENGDYLVNCLINNPGMKTLYMIAMTSIKLNKNDIIEIIKLIDSFGYKDYLIESFKKMDNVAYKYFEEGFDYDEIVNEATKAARQYNGLTFETVEEKDWFISDEKKYESVLKEISNVVWINDRFVDLYKMLVDFGEPHSEAYKIQYNSVMPKYKIVCDELYNNGFIEKIRKAANALLNNESSYVEKYNVENLDKSKKKLEEFFQNLSSLFAESELPILRYESNRKALIITTKAFYVSENKSKEILERFDVEDIERITVNESGLISSGSVIIYTSSNCHCIIDSVSLSGKEFTYITRFANELIKVVANNSKIINRYIQGIVSNSPKGFFDEKNILKELRNVVLFRYLIKKTRFFDIRSDNLIFKWNFEINHQDSGALQTIYTLVERNNLGAEWLIYYDGDVLLTNKRIYFFSKYDDIDNKIDFFNLDDYFEFFSCKKETMDLVEYRMYLFLDDRGNVKANYRYNRFSNKSGLEELMDIISSANLIIRNCYSFYHNKVITYCRNCNKVIYSSDRNSKYKKIRRCPKCNSKSENGYEKSFWVYERVKECLEELDEKKVIDEIELMRSNIQKLVINSQKKSEDGIVNPSNKNDDKQSNQKGFEEFINEFVEEERKKPLVEFEDDEITKKVFCVYCGNKINKNSKFCNFCGKNNKYGG